MKEKQDTGMEKEVSFFNVKTWSNLAESIDNGGWKVLGVKA